MYWFFPLSINHVKNPSLSLSRLYHTLRWPQQMRQELTCDQSDKSDEVPWYTCDRQLGPSAFSCVCPDTYPFLHPPLMLSWDLRGTYPADYHFIRPPHPHQGPHMCNWSGTHHQPLASSSHHIHQMTIWWATLKRPQRLSGPSISFLRAPLKHQCVSSSPPPILWGPWESASDLRDHRSSKCQKIFALICFGYVIILIYLYRDTHKNLRPRVDRIDNWGKCTCLRTRGTAWVGRESNVGPIVLCYVSYMAHLTISRCPGWVFFFVVLLPSPLALWWSCQTQWICTGLSISAVHLMWLKQMI